MGANMTTDFLGINFVGNYFPNYKYLKMPVTMMGLFWGYSALLSENSKFISEDNFVFTYTTYFNGINTSR
jgi:hypothetical protein